MRVLRQVAWPWRGLGWFLARPWLWWLPLVAQAALLAMVVFTGVSVGAAVWPGTVVWWKFILQAGAAVSAGLMGAALIWIIVGPLVTAVVLDRLVAAVFREQGIACVDHGWWRTFTDAVIMIGRTMPSRLLWVLVALVGMVIPIVGPFLGSYAVCRVICLDAFDTALAGMDGRHALRATGLQRHRADRVGGALAAMALKLALMITGVGMLFWLPGIVCGAALRVADDLKIADRERERESPAAVLT